MQSTSLCVIVILLQAAREVVHQGLITFGTSELHEAHACLLKRATRLDVHASCLFEMLSFVKIICAQTSQVKPLLTVLSIPERILDPALPQKLAPRIDLFVFECREEDRSVPCCDKDTAHK